MHLRNQIRQYISVKIGNRKNCNFLFDNWSSEGPWNMVLDQREVSYMRFTDKESIADVWGRQISFTGRGITSNILKVKEAMTSLG
ncbi:hypothetical protein LIER_40772 [Lithospermum erythrorhizon]|uniref:Uncharacterized protein n=1 Tax=Lithospermum erythrorhizon TaxID=34254 RepID=A0AAV3R0Y1_LITER